MDVILHYSDYYVFTPYIYPRSWPVDNAWRQFLTLNIVVDISAIILYLTTALLSWLLIFDKRLLQHPLVLKNQVRREIRYALTSMPLMGLPTCALFLLEVRGYSQLYDRIQDASYGWMSIAGGLVTFLMFTDFQIYWVHRWMHHRLIYKHVHKPHHMWVVPSPFASHAFHPIDGFLQSLPYHVYVFLFPMHKFTYLMLYLLVNVWTVSIHDGDYRVPRFLQPFINGSAHHMDHHIYYNYNYGQYLTLWDRLCGSFRHPSAYDADGPLDQVKASIAAAEKAAADTPTRVATRATANGKKRD